MIRLCRRDGKAWAANVAECPVCGEKRPTVDAGATIEEFAAEVKRLEAELDSAADERKA